MKPRDLMKEIEKGLPEIIIGKPSFRFDEDMSQTGSFSMRLTGESTEELVALVAHRRPAPARREGIRLGAHDGQGRRARDPGHRGP